MGAGNLWLRNKAYSLRWRRIIVLGATLCALWCVPLEWVLADCVPLCLFRTVSGHECYGCGMTRACFSLLHGHWEEALRYNWRCVIVVPVMTFLCVRFIMKGSHDEKMDLH